MDEKMKKLAQKLEMRNFDVYCCESGSEAKETALSLIESGESVAWGGSKTINEIGLIDALRNGGYNLIDRDAAENAEEKFELMRCGLTADVFLMSTNAVSEDGILVNIDGLGNRVAAMCFGPKKVIIVMGRNKLCQTVEDAEYRARNTAAVKNAERFGLTKTGCSRGKCSDCLSDECMCTYIVRTRRNKIDGRIKVILVDEELGF